MNPPTFLAQTPTLIPSVTPTATATAKAIASVTPTHTPTATPFHVVMEQAPFWNSALGIFIVIVIVAGFGHRVHRAERRDEWLGWQAI